MRLPDLDPERVADEAHSLVVGQAHALASAAGYSLHADQPVSDIRHAVHALALYARDGTHPEGRPELVAEYLISLAPLYTRATDRGSYDVPALDLDGDGGEPADELSLVVVAAVARDLIACGKPVGARDLAVLSGLTRRQVLRLADSGELRRGKDGSYAAREAQRWLGARGVGGFR